MHEKHLEQCLAHGNSSINAQSDDVVVDIMTMALFL